MAESLVLGIESSCDETAVAVVKDGISVVANRVASQTDLHKRYGGVVPEVASRRHYEIFPPLVQEALSQAGITYDHLSGVAVTAAPGLIGALLVGLSFAKGLAFRLGLPLAAVNHIEAHLYACQLDDCPVEFPALGLVVSGGHTEIHRIHDWGDYQTLCATRDDAAGEAFDKVAKLLGLEYPGGPALEIMAREIQGDPGLFPLTKMKDKSRDFSFSGLKTAVALEVRKRRNLIPIERVRLAARFQNTVITEILVRLRPLLVKEGPKSLVVGGGVACNGVLRAALHDACRELGVELRIPPPSYCTDNAAMVAGLGACQILRGLIADFSANAVASPSSSRPFLIK